MRSGHRASEYDDAIWLKAVRPKPDIAPLARGEGEGSEAKASAASVGGEVQRGGPDRIRTRGIERSSTACSSVAWRSCSSSSPQVPRERRRAPDGGAGSRQAGRPRRACGHVWRHVAGMGAWSERFADNGPAKEHDLLLY